MNRHILLISCALALPGCTSTLYSPAPFQSEGFKVTQGTQEDFAQPQSVCLQPEPGAEHPFLSLPPELAQYFPACNTALPTVRVYFFILPTGCTPAPCTAPLGGYAVLSTGHSCDHHAQALWSSSGGSDPSSVFAAFQRELSPFLFPPSR